jgi:hypothetical protein
MASPLCIQSKIPLSPFGQVGDLQHFPNLIISRPTIFNCHRNVITQKFERLKYQIKVSLKILRGLLSHHVEEGNRKNMKM